MFAVHGQFGNIDLQLAHNEDEQSNPDARTKIETAKNILVDQQFALGYLDLFAKASAAGIKFCKLADMFPRGR